MADPSAYFDPPPARLFGSRGDANFFSDNKTHEHHNYMLYTFFKIGNLSQSVNPFSPTVYAQKFFAAVETLPPCQGLALCLRSRTILRAKHNPLTTHGQSFSSPRPAPLQD